MKCNFFLFSLILLFSSKVLAQNQTLIVVVDNVNHVTLKKVSAKNLKNNSIQLSNNKGELKLIEKGSYLISCIGYSSKIIEVNNLKKMIIELSQDYTQLNEVIIKSYHIPSRLKKATSSINLITSKDIQKSNSINFTSVLNRVPGIYMHSGALNTNRITIRGIGSRNLFGTSKIRAYYDDIPLTTGNGATSIEDFELNSISRFEIFSGASSSVYGAGLGGVIHLFPQKAFLNSFELENEISVGSYGLIKESVNVNYGKLNNSFRLIYSSTHSDGYRENNEYNRQTFTFSSNHYINEKNKLTFLSSIVDLKAFIPSSLDKDTFDNNPSAAAFTWGQARGFEDAKRGIVGFSWNHDFSKSLKLITSVFTSFKKSYEPRPFNILSENIFAIGFRSRINGNHKLFNRDLRWTIGSEIFRDTYKYKTFENLYRDFPVGTGSVEGNKISDSKENRSYINIFFETNLDFTTKTTLSLGVNYNRTNYNIDRLQRFKYNGIFSPKLGVSHLLSENVSIYSNISHGFSPVSTEDTLLPNGDINTEIKPETGWNFEIGTRGSVFENKLRYNIALYRLDVRNLLVSRRTAEDAFIGVNAGRTIHDGLELTVNYYWIKTDPIKISNSLSLAFNDYLFKDFIDDNNDFSGNDLTGIPSEVINVGLDIETKFGIYGNVNFQHVGRIPITDSNSLYSNDYNLTNLKIGYEMKVSKRIKLNTFLGLNNLFNIKYASQILINAQGFGTNQPRYFYRGNPANYYLGVNAKIEL